MSDGKGSRIGCRRLFVRSTSVGWLEGWRDWMISEFSPRILKSFPAQQRQLSHCEACPRALGFCDSSRLLYEFCEARRLRRRRSTCVDVLVDLGFQDADRHAAQ